MRTCTMCQGDGYAGCDGIHFPAVCTECSGKGELEDLPPEILPETVHEEPVEDVVPAVATDEAPVVDDDTQ